MGGMLTLDGFLDGLGYLKSPYYLKSDEFQQHPAYAHYFRKAEDTLGLKGVYTLRARPEQNIQHDTVVPVVYVVELESDDPEKIRQWHKKVWNQSLVPFILLVTPTSFRLYRGFKYSERQEDDSVLNELQTASHVINLFNDFKAESIDSGLLWRNRSKDLHLDCRVDSTLLDNLGTLRDILVKRHRLDKHIAHALIGKYIFLRYLRDRDHLSDKKLEEFGIAYDDIFGANARIGTLYDLETKLNGWLNGAIFQLPPKSEGLKTDHVKAVADAFYGHAPCGQQSLFSLFNFKYIPIETLSEIYEDFLHSDSKGRERSAYYTPVHLVDLILEELDKKRPLKEGMRVFDPSCGSGTFLVLSYRRLIEQEFAKKQDKKINPSRLRELLTNHIFGLDIDEDACGIAELSLALTLLDYVNPKDLKSYSNFKLPNLRNKNIFHCPGGFFDEDSEWAKSEITKEGYDWIVGNPPWKKINSKSTVVSDKPALLWMKENKAEHPVGSNQIAQAFAWKVRNHLGKIGQAGLVMPAMTLFARTAKTFRELFFKGNDVWKIANFANMTYTLFAAKIKSFKNAKTNNSKNNGSESPAALFFFSRNSKLENFNGYTSVFSPLIAEQEAHRNTKRHTWRIVAEQNAIRTIPSREIISGDSLPWKVAMWGSWRDMRLLRLLERRFQSLADYRKKRLITVQEGIQLGLQKDPTSTALLEEAIGRDKLVMGNIKKNTADIFHFPNKYLEPISRNKAYWRLRGGKAGLLVSRPPHIFVAASRNLSIYSDTWINIPARQIGISGTDKTLLKALSLFLVSNFGRYHQFMYSAQWGIQKSIANLETLLKLPIPFWNLSDSSKNFWEDLHSQFVKESKLTDAGLFSKKRQLENGIATEFKKLKRILNQEVYKLLGLRDNERYLIEDFINVRMSLIKGKVSKEAMSPVSDGEIKEYARILRSEINEFLGVKKHHQVDVYKSSKGVVVLLENKRSPVQTPISIFKQNECFDDVYQQLKKNLENRKQWLYFDRNLKIYDGYKTYLFKPRERLHWLKSQALIDADEIIADKLSETGN